MASIPPQQPSSRGILSRPSIFSRKLACVLFVVNLPYGRNIIRISFYVAYAVKRQFCKIFLFNLLIFFLTCRKKRKAIDLVLWVNKYNIYILNNISQYTLRLSLICAQAVSMIASDLRFQISNFNLSKDLL